VLVEAEHVAMEEIMANVSDSDVQPPVAVVCQRHLETVLQRVSPSVKVQLYFIDCLFHSFSDSWSRIPASKVSAPRVSECFHEVGPPANMKNSIECVAGM